MKITELITAIFVSTIAGMCGMAIGTIASPIIQVILVGAVNKTAILIFASITGAITGLAAFKYTIGIIIKNAVEEALEDN